MAESKHMLTEFGIIHKLSLKGWYKFRWLIYLHGDGIWRLYQSFVGHNSRRRHRRGSCDHWRHRQSGAGLDGHNLSWLLLLAAASCCRHRSYLLLLLLHYHRLLLLLSKLLLSLLLRQLGLEVVRNVIIIILSRSENWRLMASFRTLKFKTCKRLYS